MNFSQPVSNMEHLKKLWPIWQFLFLNEAHFKHPALAFINSTHRFVLPHYLAKIKVSFLLKTAVSWKFTCVWCVLAALLTASLIFGWWLSLNFYFLDYLFYSVPDLISLLYFGSEICKLSDHWLLLEYCCI